MTTANPGQRDPKQPSPFSLDRDFKAETAYVVLSIAVWIGLIVTARLAWAVAWFMVTFFMFGVWRIGRARFK
jgi:hypothetical protein